MTHKLISKTNMSDSEKSNRDLINELMEEPEDFVQPGIILNNKYVLLRCIGAGNNARVWISYQFDEKRFVAVKVQYFECYDDGCREVVIVDKITKFYNKNPNSNFHSVTLLDNFILSVSNDMKYVCSVYDLYAGSISMTLDSGIHKYGLPIKTVKNIARQLLSTLVVLHESLKVIHTDIKPENILFKGISPDQQKIMDMFNKDDFDAKYQKLVDEFSNDKYRFEEELEILGVEAVQKIKTLNINVNENEDIIPDDSQEESSNDYLIEGEESEDYSDVDENYSDFDDEFDEEEPRRFNKRDQSVDDVIEILDCTLLWDFDDPEDPEEIPDYDFNKILNNRNSTSDHSIVIDEKYIENCEIALTDYGNSYFYVQRTRNEIQDRKYRAPEVILDISYGFACDIWSSMCVIFELLTGFALFHPYDEPVNRDQQHLYLMEKNLGPMPKSMKKYSKRAPFLFDKKRGYQIKNIVNIQSYPLKDRLIEQFLFSEKDASEISEFLLLGLAYKPLKRYTARQLLSHKWLADN